MSQIQFAGSWYLTIARAAAAWAETALPDTSVVGADEEPATVAQTLEAFWWGEALKIGEAQPEGASEDAWRANCRAALVSRIERARAAA